MMWFQSLAWACRAQVMKNCYGWRMKRGGFSLRGIEILARWFLSNCWAQASCIFVYFLQRRNPCIMNLVVC